MPSVSGSERCRQSLEASGAVSLWRRAVPSVSGGEGIGPEGGEEHILAATLSGWLCHSTLTPAHSTNKTAEAFQLQRRSASPRVRSPPAVTVILPTLPLSPSSAFLRKAAGSSQSQQLVGLPVLSVPETPCDTEAAAGAYRSCRSLARGWGGSCQSVWIASRRYTILLSEPRRIHGDSAPINCQ